ncbi:tryptophan synthase subunit alpha [Mucisphaera calidilacus]|uniref:Tryptophan synthase alpha chain n=1 Tax=Mucisphaera calidilacus TaxID=2527982 RepID=A0A518BWC4_9BACT|nr:tryptophan synthase subunit alpha [Mucisphaera calidilacus]QDU71270.1 Tryptophan synthase alpha chain [Mucisphaera calidilacus]
MNRILGIFEQHKSNGSRALMPFITAGDPDIECLPELIRVAEQNGASLCEIGVPFSDPIADGPVIQESMTHALDQGLRLEQVFEAIAAVRPETSLGIVAMVSFSIVHRYGLRDFINKAADSGFDGFIFPDLPLEAAQPVQQAAREAGTTLSLLIAPTTPLDRAAEIARASSGFAYIVSRAGITGEQDQLPPGLEERLQRLREHTEIPLAVGFGVSKPAHVKAITDHAEGVIVGSALVRRISDLRQSSREQILDAAGAYIRELASGLPQGAPSPTAE